MANFIIKMINLLIKGLGSALSLIFALLPRSPFKVIDNSPISEYLGTFNYFFPISEIIVILQLWLVAVGGYYIVQTALRWIKAIE